MDKIESKSVRGAKEVLSDFLKDESGKEMPPDMMVKALRTTLASMALYAAIPDDAAAAGKNRRAPIEQLSEQGFSKKDFESLAKNVFFEASLEGPAGQLAVAQVTFARLASRRWGNTMHEVIYAKHQFSWTAHEQKLTGATLAGVEGLATVFSSRFKGKTAEQIVSQLSEITGLPPETLFYKRADWREDDVNENRMTERTKQVFQSLIWLKNIGDHAFYMEPPKEARLEKITARN